MSQTAELVVRQISAAWLDGRVDDLAGLLHPDIVMALPGFAGAARGRDAMLAGFRDFCENATVHEYRELDHHIDVTDDVAVATFRFEMVYERDGGRFRCTGRDFWVLRHQPDRWLAVWRTMLDVDEKPL